MTDEAAGVTAFAAASDRLIVAAPTYVGVDDPHAHHERLQKAGPSMRHYKTMPVRHWQSWLGPPVHLLHVEGAVDLTPDATLELHDSSFVLSPDGGRVAAAWGQDVGRLRSDRVWVYAFGGEAMLLGTPLCRYSALRFSPNGQKLAAARERRREGGADKRELVVFDLDSRDERVLAPDWDRFPAPLAWVDDAHILVRAGDLNDQPLFSLGLDGKHRRLLGPTVGDVDTKDGRVFAIASDLRHPPTPTRFDSGAQTSVDLARWLLADAPTEPSLRVENVTATASDGEEVHGLLVLPEGEGPHPLVFWIHGGPIGQFGDQWHWRWNVLPFVQAGFAVAMPNARGSTGRGDAFMSAIYQDWAGQCHRDLLDYAAMLVERSDIDAKRVAAMGGSFGGYMTNWIGGHPDARVDFRALVTHASLYDLRAFYGATDYRAFFGDFFGGTPWSGDVQAASPHIGISNWTAPTLVLHGEKDYRVPIGEALALFEALQAHGVESELAVFPDEGHWIEKPKNVVAWYSTVIDFLHKHLEDR